MLTRVSYCPMRPNSRQTGVENRFPPSSEYEMQHRGSVSMGWSPDARPWPTTKLKSALGMSQRWFGNAVPCADVILMTIGSASSRR